MSEWPSTSSRFLLVLNHNALAEKRATKMNERNLRFFLDKICNSIPKWDFIQNQRGEIVFCRFWQYHYFPHFPVARWKIGSKIEASTGVAQKIKTTQRMMCHFYFGCLTVRPSVCRTRKKEIPIWFKNINLTRAMKCTTTKLGCSLEKVLRGKWHNQKARKILWLFFWCVRCVSAGRVS